MKFVTRCILAAAFAVSGLVAAPQTRAADVDPLLPAETEQVLFLNVRQVIDSELVKKFALAQIKQALEGNDAQDMMKELGLDPLKDINSVSAGLWGDDPQNMQGVFVVRGNFDLVKLFEAAEKQAKKDGDRMSIVKDGDYTLIRVTIDNRPDPIYMTGVDKNTIAIGTEKALVTGAMKAAETKAKPAMKQGLADLVTKMDGKASLFICGVSSGKVGEIPPNPLFDNPEKLQKQLEKLTDTAMTLRVTGDIALDVMMVMKDTEAADDFGVTVDDLLNKAKAFLPFIAMQNQNLRPIVNDLSKTLNSKVEKNQVNITAKLSGDAISRAAGADD